MTDRDHPPDTLVQRLAAQFRGAEFGHDHIRVASQRCDYTILQSPHDSADSAVACARGQRDNRMAARRHQRTANEIALSAGAYDINARGDLRVYLSGEIDFDCKFIATNLSSRHRISARWVCAYVNRRIARLLCAKR